MFSCEHEILTTQYVECDEYSISFVGYCLSIETTTTIDFTPYYDVADHYYYYVGVIPPEIGQLTNLINLYLQDNELTGSIPSEIGDLTNLQELNLSNSDIKSNYELP